MATVADSPLDKKVEMTNWEKVCGDIFFFFLVHVRLSPAADIRICRSHYSP